MYQKFPSKILCLTVPTKNSVGESFIVALLSGIEKVWRRGGWVSRISVNNFLSHSADEKFRRRILYCCINFGYRKSLEQRGGGVTRFSVKNFCLTVPTKISVGESFIVALISGIEKSLEKRGGGYQDFPSKKFCLTVPKISVGESFTVAFVFLEGGVSNFYVENFLSHGAEKFRWGMLYCCTNFWNRKCLERGAGVSKI